MPQRKWRVEILDEVDGDLDRASDHYLGEAPHVLPRFLTAVDDAIAKVLEAPRRWPLMKGRVRRVFVPGFPYKIIYRTTRASVRIIAVPHSSQSSHVYLRRR